jgi:hypothetical protein
LLKENPALAELPEYKDVLAASEGIKEVEKKLGVKVDDGGKENPPAAPTAEEDGGKGAGAGAGGEKQNKNALSALAFFGEGDEQVINTDDITLDALPELAEKLGINTEEKGWLGKLASAVTKPAEDFSDKYNTLVEGLNSLPKELGEAVNAVLEGKDWRTVFNSASTIDFSKDFSALSNEEKVKVHNFYFPEDKIDEGQDLSAKEIKKALAAVESKYSADKFIKIEKEKAIAKDNELKRNSFIGSADASIKALTDSYKGMKKSEIKKVEEIIKVNGIQSVFFDKKGNLLPDAAEKLAFALNGKAILETAVQLAENKGKSAGKAESLNIDKPKPKGRGENVLTDEEKAVLAIVKESKMANELTY